MAQDALSNCKKYIIQKIISPVSYWITEVEDEKYDKKEMKQFNGNLEKNLKKCTDTDQIFIGQMVAVKYNDVFHRGKIKDIFQRFKKSVYLVLLVDIERSIETKKESIYLIENQKLKYDIKKEFEISIHGIQPAEFNINHTEPYSHGIFHLRKSDKWTPIAFKFVKNLLKNIPYIFVKIISWDDKKVYGEIYFIRNSDGVPVSVGQTLCDEGFAVFYDMMQCSAKKCECWSLIEKKIPTKALLSDHKLNEKFEKINISNNNKKKCNLNIRADQTESPGFMSWAYRSCQNQNPRFFVQNGDFHNSDSSSSCDSDDLSIFSICTFDALCSSISCSSFIKGDS